MIGTDAAGAESLPPVVQQRLRTAQLVVAPERLQIGLQIWLAAADLEATAPELMASDDIAPLMSRLEQARQAHEVVVVLASGDPLWFGIGRLLIERFGAGALRFD
ncbi:MAG: bifunctional cobalt-precorrin-7 (C(5))-methyltransferase/cobalt-precorrin-6B (C(15))-methyltransferase, partial [Cyanobacteria bacterium K_DeepCast_35m_m2_023]|nr:bifunctional cobalt-precorrin-7 (C(5))-methyltransferase/cobalt-precorrin-6B (C(15))-methyltransferase [Cyanobacteria bacterium K_DeepCast_35m_m2_023]